VAGFTVKTAETPDVISLEIQLRQRFNVVEQRLTLGSFCFRMLHPRSADDLIDEVAFNYDERLPYWAEIWPSAYVLAQRIADIVSPALSRTERGTEEHQQPRLLELGCGCGLAIMAALAAGFSVTAADYYPEALEFVRLNAALNGLPPPETRTVDWREYPPELVDFDVVIAADVLYERNYSRLIAAAFQQSLRPNGLGLLTDPQRTKAESFPDDCRHAGMHIAAPEVFGPLSVPGGDPGVRQTVNLFKIRRQHHPT
jgi:ETFB lysine methyltransferase